MTNANRSTKTLLVVILCLSVLLAALLAGLVCLQSGLFDSAETPTTAPTSGPTDPTTRPTDPTTQPTDPTTQPTDPTEPTEPPVEKLSSATITATAIQSNIRIDGSFNTKYAGAVSNTEAVSNTR